MSATEQSSRKSSPVVNFGHPITNAASLTDAAFLKAIRWRKSGDAELVAAARSGDVSAFVARLRETLPLKPTAKATKKGSDATVSLAAADYLGTPPAEELASLINGETAATAARKNGKSVADRHQHLTKLLKELDSAKTKPTPSDLHALIDVLLEQATALDDERLFRLWRTTLTVACGLPLGQAAPADGDPAENADAQLFVAGELPWRVGLLYADIKGATKLRRRGRKLIRRELADRTDGDGTPHATLLPRLGYWLASLIRSGQWAHRFRASLWDDDSSVLFNDLLEHAIRLYRPAGRLAMSNGFIAEPQNLFRAAAQLAGSDFKIPELAYAWNGRGTRGRKPKLKKQHTMTRNQWRQLDVAPASQSDWADLACLRSDWEPACNSIIVNYNGVMPQIDMTVLGRSLFRGRWDVQIRVDGKPVDIKRQWTAICWNSDEDGDYLELQQSFAGGGRIERQIWLSRTLHFAVFADSLGGFSGEQVEYTGRLPLAAGLDAQSCLDRETRFKDGPVLTRVCPLHLPQDRVYSTPGGCGVFGDDLVVKHVSAGSGLYAPVYFDWHPDRRRKPAQWRQLTVTEDGRILRGDAAAGFRIRIGQHHLLAYRKLKKTDQPHSVLGFQTADETVLGRFDKNGDVTPLLLVE